jgi:hypothetical protein
MSLSRALAEMYPPPIGPADVEKEIRRFVDLLEGATDENAPIARAAALADARYKKAHAGALLSAKGRTVADREAIADLECASEYEARQVADMLWKVQQEKQRNLRAQMDALRSINANTRHLLERT